MKKLYYEKQGRKYVLISEYDSELMDSFTEGNHLVMSYPGGQSRRYNIDPNYAAMVAAGRHAEYAISKAIVKASEMRPQKTPLTLGQRRAWKKLAREFGDELCTLNHGSASDLADAGVKAMQEEADKLMKHEAVKQAYDHFMFVAKLAYDENKASSQN